MTKKDRDIGFNKYVFVQGVKIYLIESQIKLIQAELLERKKHINSFDNILRHFGFTKVDASEWLNKKALAYEHKELEWWAEIINHGCWSCVWMVGNGLKHGSFPGGWIYNNPEDIEKEISRAIDAL